MNINENQESSASQNQKIAAYLQQGNSITQLEALKLFGCFRLASRISDLRKSGMEIISGRIITPTGKRVASYALDMSSVN